MPDLFGSDVCFSTPFFFSIARNKPMGCVFGHGSQFFSRARSVLGCYGRY